MRSIVAAALIGLPLTACSPPMPTGSVPTASTPTAMAPGTHASFGQLRSHPLSTLRLAASGACPKSPRVTIKLGGIAVLANGTSPFYFGPWGGDGQSAGDFNKTPWSADSDYAGRMVIRGRQIDGPGVVGFGFWPQGLGTPAEQPGVPILFSRPDQEGRTVIYQPELDVERTIFPGASGGGFWSFPLAGCYAIQSDGDSFSHTTVIAVA